MHSVGNLSFLKAVTRDAEEMVAWAQTAHARAGHPSRLLADMRMRDRRTRGCRGTQRQRKAPAEGASPCPSAALHRAYRQPQPPPPPNSPRIDVLGLSSPLQGAAFVNPRGALASPGESDGGSGSDGGGDLDDTDFDSDGLRELESCTGAAAAGRRAVRAFRRAVSQAPARAQLPPPGRRYSFFDVFYNVVREEAKRRAAIKLDLSPLKEEENENSGKGDGTFIERRGENALESENPFRITEEMKLPLPLRSKRLLSFRYNGRKSDENGSLVQSSPSQPRFPCTGVVNISDVSPSLVQNSETNLPDPSTHAQSSTFIEKNSLSHGNEEVKNSNSNLVIESKRCNVDNESKRQHIATQELITKLTERGIHYSSHFDVGKMKPTQTSGMNPANLKHKRISNTRNRFRNRSSPTYLQSILDEACEIATTIRKNEELLGKGKENVCSESNRLNHFLSPASTMQNSIENVGIKTISERLEKSQYEMIAASGDVVTREKDRFLDMQFKSISNGSKTANSITNRSRGTETLPTKRGISVNVNEEIARHDALFKEINESLSRAYGKGVSNESSESHLNTSNINGSMQENVLSSTKNDMKSSLYEKTAKNTKETCGLAKDKKTLKQEAVYNLIKQMVKLKRVRNMP